ncbi:Choline transporter-like protein 2 [Diplonema papillatum]|nr:Choline transporter-like protein 2 [Diplonema papillatum]
MGASKEQEAEQQRLAARYAPKRFPPANEVGYYADRGCTDLCGFLLYAVAWFAMMFLTTVVLKEGDPQRLLFGIDREGNLCGHHGDSLPFEVDMVDSNGTKLAWSDLNKIVYPLPSAETCAKRLVAPDGPTCEDLIKDTLNLGLCVAKCPSSDDHVTWYDGTDYYNGVEVGFDVRFDMKEVVHRCIPVDPSQLTGNIAELFDVAGTLRAAVGELEESVTVIIISAVACTVISFLWLFVLRRAVKPCVYLTLLLLFVASAVVAYICASNWRRSASDEMETVWLILTIGTGLWFVIYCCLLLFFCKNIAIACDTIEEASRIPLSIPTMAIVPPVIVLLLIPVFAFHVLVGLYIETTGSIKEETMQAYLNATDPDGHLGPATDVLVDVLNSEQWATYAHLYNVFMFLWSAALLKAIGFLVLAFCAVFWYWSVPGDDKKPDAGVVVGVWWTIRYHLGTLMLGSFIIAVVQFLQYLLAKFESRLRKISDSPAVDYLIKCAQCCLACFERLIKFISRNAFIMTALCSDNFCNGARRALFLLLSHAFSVIAVNFIAEWVIFFGKILIMAATSCTAYWLIIYADMAGKDREPEDTIIPLICVALLAYVISSVFAIVFSVCIDTVLLSFCHDLDINNGKDKPYYLPSDLQNSLDKYNSMATDRPNFSKLDSLDDPYGAGSIQNQYNVDLKPPPGKRGWGGNTRNKSPLEHPLTA